jgi:hypothetical protein
VLDDRLHVGPGDPSTESGALDRRRVETVLREEPADDRGQDLGLIEGTRRHRMGVVRRDSDRRDRGYPRDWLGGGHGFVGQRRQW